MLEQLVGGFDGTGKSLKNAMSDESRQSIEESQSFGIKADPLVKFSVIFCALIHDVGKSIHFVRSNGVIYIVLISQKLMLNIISRRPSWRAK